MLKPPKKLQSLPKLVAIPLHCLQAQRKKLQRSRLFCTCSELSISRFFKISETGDLSWLQKKRLPASQSVKSEVWGEIQQEFALLTSSDEYYMQLRKAGADILKYNQLNGLVSLYHLCVFEGISEELLQEELRYWKVSGSDLNALRLAILREKTRLNIESIRIEAEKSSNKKRAELEELLVAVENGLGRNSINPEITSVKKWVYLCKSLEEKLRILRQQHGRQDRA